jgi:L-fuconate dehydratase
LVQCIDFRYLSDALTEHEALDILRRAEHGKAERIDFLVKRGYPPTPLRRDGLVIRMRN